VLGASEEDASKLLGEPGGPDCTVKLATGA
jgi:hypothetical protein